MWRRNETRDGEAGCSSRSTLRWGGAGYGERPTSEWDRGGATSSIRRTMPGKIIPNAGTRGGASSVPGPDQWRNRAGSVILLRPDGRNSLGRHAGVPSDAMRIAGPLQPLGEPRWAVRFGVNLWDMSSMALHPKSTAAADHPRLNCSWTCAGRRRPVRPSSRKFRRQTPMVSNR